MGVIKCEEQARERTQSGKDGGSYEYTRGFMVYVDAVDTPLPDITNSAGINFRDPYPDDPSCVAMEFSTQPTSESLLHYTIKVKYTAPPKPPDPNNDPGEDPTLLPPIPYKWTASTSISQSPAPGIDETGADVLNSAGEAIRPFNIDVAIFHLTLEVPYAGLGWLRDAKTYTGNCNSGPWMGGAQNTWRCAGYSAQPQSDNNAGITRSWWQVKIDFAYNPKQWDVILPDMGYAQKVTDDGTPSAAGAKNARIKGQDGKPLAHPVALVNGVAAGPGVAPGILSFRFHKLVDFSIFPTIG
jgi:hypothetical protein